MSIDRIVRFVGRHMDATFECVHERTEDVVFSNETPDEGADKDAFAHNLWEFISEDAAILGGRQVYVMRARKNEKVNGRLVCAIDSDTPFHALDTGKQQGVLQGQLMRHNERLMGLNHQLVKMVLPFGSDYYIEKASQFFKKEEELAALRASAVRQANEEKRAAAQHDFDLAAKKEIFDVVRLLVPTTVNALSGKAILPEKTHAGFESLKAFAKTITPTQVQLLGAILDPAQTLTFLEFMKTVHAEEKEREKESSHER